MTLITHTILVFQILSYTTAFALMNTLKEHNNVRIKRVPADGFSLFGLTPRFTVANTISRAQQPLNTVSQFFRPTVNQHTNQETYNIVVDSPRGNSNNEPERYIISTYTIQQPDQYVNKQKETSSSYILLEPNTTNKFNEPNNDNNKEKQTEEYQDDNDYVQSDKGNETERKESITNNSSKELLGPDKDLINSIFNNMKYRNDIDSTSTPDDTTIDYTTGTGDYETSTTDDLLRIPPAAVATLLGK